MARRAAAFTVDDIKRTLGAVTAAGVPIRRLRFGFAEGTMEVLTTDDASDGVAMDVETNPDQALDQFLLATEK